MLKSVETFVKYCKIVLYLKLKKPIKYPWLIENFVILLTIKGVDMCDIVIKSGDKRFNFRVAILPYKESKVLLQKVDRNDFYSLVGGRVKLGEQTSIAICREVNEELGLNINVGDVKLLRVCENFFKYDDKNFHEILFVYACDFSFVKNFNDLPIKDKTDAKALWVGVDELKGLSIKPEFIKNINFFDELKHVVITQN